MSGTAALAALKVAGDIGGPIVSSALNYRQWRKSMTEAHQMETKDLLKAGLNPILSAGGSGAHAPMAPIDVTPRSSVSAKELGEIKMQKDVQDKAYYDSVSSGAQADILTKQAKQTKMETDAFPTLLKERIKSQVLTNNSTSAMNAKINLENKALQLDNVEREANAKVYGTPGVGPAVKAIEKLPLKAR